jgi:hypothetical protein
MTSFPCSAAALLPEADQDTRVLFGDVLPGFLVFLALDAHDGSKNADGCSTFSMGPFEDFIDDVKAIYSRFGPDGSHS